MLIYFVIMDEVMEFVLLNKKALACYTLSVNNILCYVQNVVLNVNFNSPCFFRSNLTRKEVKGSRRVNSLDAEM